MTCFGIYYLDKENRILLQGVNSCLSSWNASQQDHIWRWSSLLFDQISVCKCNLHSLQPWESYPYVSQGQQVTVYWLSDSWSAPTCCPTAHLQLLITAQAERRQRQTKVASRRKPPGVNGRRVIIILKTGPLSLNHIHTLPPFSLPSMTSIWQYWV